MARFFYLFFGFSLAKHVKCDGFSGIPGSYCSARQPDCCPDRNDQCSVPIQGTECYCDDFCDRRKNGSIPDCCPDFFAHCRNESVETTTAASTSPPITIPSTRPELEPGKLMGNAAISDKTKRCSNFISRLSVVFCELRVQRVIRREFYWLPSAVSGPGNFPIFRSFVNLKSYFLSSLKLFACRCAQEQNIRKEIIVAP